MKGNLLFILINLVLIQKIHSQQPIDIFLHNSDSIQQRNDSIVASGFYDTLINNLKLKIISQYSSERFKLSHNYYGKLQFKNEKPSGNYIIAEECRPCYFFEYRSDGTLYEEGVFDGEECPIGYTTKYFTNGNKSMTFNMAIRTNYDGDGCPGILNGKETYYNFYGDSLFSRFYNYRELISQTPYQINSTGDVKVTVGERVLLINDTITFKDLEKIKLQADTIKNHKLINGYEVSFDIFQNNKYRGSYSANLDFKYHKKKATKYSKMRKFKFKNNAPRQMVIYINIKDESEPIEAHLLVIKK